MTTASRGKGDARSALDAMLAVVRARKVDVVACVKLDRLAHSVHHLVAMVRELEALGVDLVVLDQAIDTTTASGRLLFRRFSPTLDYLLAQLARPGRSSSLGGLESNYSPWRFTRTKSRSIDT